MDATGSRLGLFPASFLLVFAVRRTDDVRSLIFDKTAIGLGHVIMRY